MLATFWCGLMVRSAVNTAGAGTAAGLRQPPCRHQPAGLRAVRAPPFALNLPHSTLPCAPPPPSTHGNLTLGCARAASLNPPHVPPSLRFFSASCIACFLACFCWLLECVSLVRGGRAQPCRRLWCVCVRVCVCVCVSAVLSLPRLCRKGMGACACLLSALVTPSPSLPGPLCFFALCPWPCPTWSPEYPLSTCPWSPQCPVVFNMCARIRPMTSSHDSSQRVDCTSGCWV